MKSNRGRNRAPHFSILSRTWLRAAARAAASRRGGSQQGAQQGEDAPRGGKPIVRGALYLIVRNRLYRGEISDKGAVYPGKHPAIIDPALWDAVQKQLVEHRATSANRANAIMPSLLTGLVYDETGDRMR
jgi:hypothetical protein